MRALLATAAFALSLSPFVHAQAAPQSVSVIDLVDGDTVDVAVDSGQTERVRLIGIDTPEVVDPRTPLQCFGREASAHAHELLDGQRSVSRWTPPKATATASDRAPGDARPVLRP